MDNFRIESNCDGSVNTDKLKEFINNYNKDVSYIFLATLGSTITSSIDDVKSIKSIFNELNKESYIHLDGALDGAFLPLVDNYQLGNYFNSVNISGHKFLGSPVPSGILIIEKKYVSKRYIEYINNDDITIGGSRNGLSPILIYHTIQSLKSEKGILEKYKSCLNKANSFLKKLNENSINAWKNDKAITIVLEHIPDIIFKKWHLPKYQNRSTLTCLPKFTEPMLMELIHDIKNHNQVYPNVSKCFNYQVESL
ncbi:pyridoxal-dependent decarboxylase [Francisella philomiragia]|uniref:pyridoxal-dependent decarboxylase n=1 Tax=Francisella philomiragia TaxID=28110 RepID=UPI003514B78A